MIKRGGDNDGRRRGKHTSGVYGRAQTPPPKSGPRTAYIDHRRDAARSKPSHAAYRAWGESLGKSADDIMRMNLGKSETSYEGEPDE